MTRRLLVPFDDSDPVGATPGSAWPTCLEDRITLLYVVANSDDTVASG
ncbi:hypothetical protein [Haloplanus pelagicus]|nr:hypothetical protein [Haloplanus sp. HW8-1]